MGFQRALSRVKSGPMHARPQGRPTLGKLVVGESVSEGRPNDRFMSDHVDSRKQPHWGSFGALLLRSVSRSPDLYAPTWQIAESSTWPIAESMSEQCPKDPQCGFLREST